MGSKSNASSRQTSTSQQFTHINDGEFAGASNFSIDESDRSVDIDYEQDIDNSIDDSYNTEIDVRNDGDNAGNSGIINILDGGVIEEGFAFGETALEENSDIVRSGFHFGEEVAGDALRLGANVVGDAFRFGDKALQTVEDTFDDATRLSRDTFRYATDFGRDSLDFGRDAFKGATDFGTQAISSLESLASENTEAIARLTERQSEALFSSLEEINDSNSSALLGLANGLFSRNATQNEAQLEAISELARNTSLQGQDIVAKTSAEQVKYIMLAIGFIGVGFMFFAFQGKK